MAWSCQIVAADGTFYEFHDVAEGRVLQRFNGRGFPSIDRHVVDPALSDGSIYKSARYGPRTMEITHTIQGQSYDDLLDKRLLLANALSPKRLSVDGNTFTLRWRGDNGQPVYEIDAQIAASIPLDGHAGLNTETYSIALVADNPLWRRIPASVETLLMSATGLSVPISVPLSLSAGDNTLEVVNAGNAISYPTITITAGESGAQTPKIVNATTDEQIQVNYIMSSGDVMTINMATRAITLNGTTNLIRYISPSSVAWGLVGGSNAVEVYLAGGTAEVVFTFHDLFAAV